jgi:subtilase family serine protease
LETLESRELLSVALKAHSHARSTTVAAEVTHSLRNLAAHQANHRVAGLQGRAHPLALLESHLKAGSSGAGPQSGPAASSLIPAQIATAYGLTSASGNGTGETIAIVDAYDDPNIQSDLNTFDAQFGLPATTVTKAFPQGQPAKNASWAQEISLDVEWAHAIAPGAQILLVETASNSYANLLAGVTYAATHANVVSMSWGGGEFSSETGAAYDGTFSANPNVTYVASSGDGGNQEWPALSPFVLAVGGTTLQVSKPSGTYPSESGWSGSGGGVSAFEPRPSFQAGVLPNAASRNGPDIAYDADPNTGFAVYDSLAYRGQSGWLQFGGTSAGAPQWAGLIALADAGRTTLGYSQTLNDIYAMPSSYLHDVVGGSNRVGTAVTGYDVVTGRGTPYADQVVAYLRTH